MNCVRGEREATRNEPEFELLEREFSTDDRYFEFTWSTRNCRRRDSDSRYGC